jgi:hypothetical protein
MVAMTTRQRLSGNIFSASSKDSGLFNSFVQWSSAWDTRTPGDKIRYLTGYVKLEKKMYYFVIKTNKFHGLSPLANYTDWLATDLEVRV